MKEIRIRRFNENSELNISDVMNSILLELEQEYKKSVKKAKDYSDTSYEDSKWFDGNSSGIMYAIETIKSKLR